MNLPTEPLLRTVGRRLYTKPSHRTTDCPGGKIGKLVYLLENGVLLDVYSLEPFIPDESWFHEESHPEDAVYTLMLKWSDKWGEECVAHFGSAEAAHDFAQARELGTYVQQRVRLILK